MVSAPIVTTSACTSTTATSTYGNGNITDNGSENPSVRGFCYLQGTSGDPTTADSVVNESGDFGTGTYSLQITGLSAGTSYRVRAYATNSAGTGYGTTVDVTTTSPSAPSVTTNAASSIGDNSATLNGNVTADGGATVTARGFVYSSSDATPTIGEGGVTNQVVSGTTGTFNYGASGLDSETLYYYQAYATNSVDTTYGGVQSFTTAEQEPTVALGSPSDTGTVTTTTPDLTFTGTDPGGDDVRYNIQIDTSNTFGGVNTYYFDGNISVTDTDGVWTDESNATDNSTSTYAYPSAASGDSGSTNGLLIKGTNITSVTGTITQVRARVYARSVGITQNAGIYTSGQSELLGTPSKNGPPGYSSYVTLSTPTGGWSLSVLQNLEALVYESSPSAISNTGMYVIEIEVTTASLIDAVSGTDAGFSGTPDNTDPFTSGQAVTYTVQSGGELTNGETYYWRVRGIDPSGSNTYGSWATTRSFDVSSGTPASSERGIYSSGSSAGSSEQGIYSTGSLTGSSERGIYSTGSVAGNSERGIYSSATGGSTPASSERGLYSYGSTSNSSERGLYTTGSLSGSSERGVYSSGSVGWYNAGWDYRVKVTALATQVDDDLTDFPVYVDLSDLPSGFHTNVNQTDARDIRVTTGDGTTEVPREVVTYDSSTDTGELHFKGTLSSSTNTDFYIYYGNASASDYAADAAFGAENVWDSNFVAVWHMQDSSPDVGQTDSTSNGNDTTGTGVESGDTTSGKLAGLAEIFDGADRQVLTDNPTMDWTSQMTVTAWAKYTTNQDGAVFVKGGGATSEMLLWYDQGVGDFTVGVYTNSGFSNGSSGGSYSSRSTDTWYHLAGSYNAGSVAMRVNKTNNFTATLGTAIQTGTASVGLGAEASGLRFLVGSIDEVRVSKTFRGTSWTDTEYNNQSNPSSFFTVGTHEANGTLANSERGIYSYGSSIGNSERGIHSIGSLTGNSERGLYHTGSVTTAAERGVYSAGVDTGSSEFDIYTTGSLSSSSERGIYSYGSTGGSSEFALHTIGSLTSSNERGIYSMGTTSGSSEALMYTIGSAAGSNERGVYSAGQDTGSSEALLYSTGSLQGSSERAIYTEGTAASAPGSSEFALYTKGADTGGSERTTYTTGSSSGSSTRTLYTLGANDNGLFMFSDWYDSGFGAVTVDGYLGITGATWSAAHDAANSDWALTSDSVVRVGLASDSGGSNWEFYRFIQTFDKPTLPVNSVITYAKVSTHLDSILHSQYSGESFEFGIYGSSPSVRDNLAVGDFDSLGSTLYTSTFDITNYAAEGSRIDFEFNAAGLAYLNSTDSIDLGMQEVLHDAADSAPTPSGSGTNRAYIEIGTTELAEARTYLYFEYGTLGSSERGTYTVALANASSERQIHTQGVDTGSSERGLYTTGGIDTSSEVGIYSSGVATTSSERGIYTFCGTIGDSERDIYTSGKATSSAERGLHTTGSLTGSDSRSVYTHGSISSSDERPVYSIGKSTGSREIAIYTTGKILGSSTRGLYSYGSASGGSERTVYTSGSSTTGDTRAVFTKGGVQDSSERSIYLGVTWAPWVDKTGEYGTIYSNTEVSTTTSFEDADQTSAASFSNTDSDISTSWSNDTATSSNFSDEY